MPGYRARKSHIMFSRTHTARGDEIYRFPANPTLSDFPLLIGEMLHRAERRAEKKARAARSLIHKIKFTIY
jgi:hypothetical protein